MARSRNIKPGFFKNEQLADLGMQAQLLFAGLWTLADRQGNLENRPRMIAAELFPYYQVDVALVLEQLADAGFIRYYQAEGQALIHIVHFARHQNPHKNEQARFPEMPEDEPQQIEKQEDIKNREKSRVAPECSQSTRADSLLLIPDSLLLIPDPDGAVSLEQEEQQPPGSPGQQTEETESMKNQKQEGAHSDNSEQPSDGSHGINIDDAFSIMDEFYRQQPGEPGVEGGQTVDRKMPPVGTIH